MVERGCFYLLWGLCYPRGLCGPTHQTWQSVCTELNETNILHGSSSPPHSPTQKTIAIHQCKEDERFIDSYFSMLAADPGLLKAVA